MVTMHLILQTMPTVMRCITWNYVACIT